MSSDEPSEPVDIARAALADAQDIARAGGRSGFRRGTGRGRRTRQENLAGRRRVTERNEGGYSGPGRDDRHDPASVRDLLSGYVEERGWKRQLAEARVFAEWAALVGADVSAHCAPSSLTQGELHIAAESTAWATQLRLLAGALLARLVAELGPDVVTKLRITGPTAPSWKHGRFSVRGSRGPRDTYG
jgi:predicted nucleic acid-binding Zn ribbon protein